MSNDTKSTVMALSESLSLHGPIAALSAVTESRGSGEILLFAIGNQIFSTVESNTGHLHTQVVAHLPDGVVVNSVASFPLQTTMSSSGAPLGLMAGAMDAVYVVNAATCEGAARPRTCRCNGRVLGIRVYEELGYVVVLTATNAVYLFNLREIQEWIGGSQGSNCTEWDVEVLQLSGPLLPLVLATDLLMWQDLNTVRGLVFPATYSGSLNVWQFESSQSNKSDFAVSECGGIIQAHDAGCAIFTVKAVRRPAGDLFVTTCSDDRSVALFQCACPAPNSAATAGARWVLLWRGVGVAFSRGRVFDVDMILDEAHQLLYCAAASEDGSVQVWRASLMEASQQALERTQCVFFRAEQHGGHGACRVRLLPHPLPSCAKKLESQDDPPALSSLFVVSGGFDGTLVTSPIGADGLFGVGSLRMRIQLSAFASSTTKASTTSPGEPRPDGSQDRAMLAQGRPQHVRGLFVDAQGRILYCTEHFLVVLPGFTTLSSSPLVGYFTWDDHLCSGARVLERADRTLYPTTLTALKVRHEGCFYAFLGTEAGCLIVAPYPSCKNASGVSVLPLWTSHRKVISLTARDWTGACAAGSTDAAVFLCSSHADQSVLLSCWSDITRTGHVLALCRSATTTLTTTVHLWQTQPGTTKFDFLVLTGDKKGNLQVFGYSLNFSTNPLATAELLTLDAFYATALMPTPIVLIEVDSSTCPAHTFLVFGDDASYQHLPLSEILLPHNAPTRYCGLVDCSLRFPMDVSSVVASSSRILVARRGTEVSVFSRGAVLHSWRRVAAYRDIKAPRLMVASIYEDTDRVYVYCTHCSNGSTIHSDRFQLSLDGASPTETLQGNSSQRVCLSSTDTSILYGGVIPGKDFNCTIYLPPPLDGFLYGNEDSSLLSMEAHSPRIWEGTGRENHGACMGARIAKDLSFRGPHHSNILALCMVAAPFDEKAFGNSPAPYWVASVGSYSTLALWDWAPPGRWCVLASTNERLDDGRSNAHDAASRRIASYSSQTEKQRRQRGGRVAVEPVERVPRFLCVCGLEAGHLLVGSSDASLRLYSYEGAASSLRRVWQWTPNTRYPKPIMALVALALPSQKTTDEERKGLNGRMHRALVGETNGVVYAVEIPLRKSPEGLVTTDVEATVRAQHQIEPSSVNAMVAAGEAEITEEGCLKWRFAVIHDSGVVHLLCYILKVYPEEEGISTHVFVSLSRLSTGLTTGRGIAWPTSSSHLFIVNEECVMCIQVDGDTGALELIAKKPVNVRCVSGFAIRRLTLGVFDVVVSGQGIEYTRFQIQQTRSSTG